jgi:hypothetical protein
MSRKRWILVVSLAVIFAGLFAYGIIAGDVGNVFEIAYKNLYFS